MVEEKIITINLRKLLIKKVKWKRSKIAVLLLKSKLKRILKTDKIKISPAINSKIWKRGMKKPPTKIKVKIGKEGEAFKIEPIG